MRFLVYLAVIFCFLPVQSVHGADTCEALLGSIKTERKDALVEFFKTGHEEAIEDYIKQNKIISKITPQKFLEYVSILAERQYDSPLEELLFQKSQFSQSVILKALAIFAGYGESFTTNIQNIRKTYPFVSEDFIQELVLQNARRYPTEVSTRYKLKIDHITSDEDLDIVGRYLVPASPNGIVLLMQIANRVPYASFKGYAENYVRSSLKTVQFIKNLERKLTSDDYLQILELAAKLYPEAFADHVGDLKIPQITLRKIIRKVPQLRPYLAVIVNNGEVSSRLYSLLSGTDVGEGSARDVSELLAQVRNSYPEEKHIHEMVEMAFDKINSYELGMQILKAAALYENQGKKVSLTSVDFISDLSGLHLRKISTQNLTDVYWVKLYGAILSLQDGLFGAVFKTIKISDELYQNPKKLLNLLIALRDYKLIRGDYNKAIESLRTSIPIDISNVDSFIQNMQVKTSESMFDKISVSMSSPLSLTQAELNRVLQLFKESKSMVTLFSRLSSRADYQQSLNLLLEAFKMQAQNKYEAWKYSGNEAQTEFLDSHQLAAWAKNRNQLSLLSWDELANSTQAKEKIITEKVSDYWKILAIKNPPKVSITEIFSYRGNPKDWIEHNKNADLKKIFWELSLQLGGKHSFEQKRRMISFIRSLLSVHPEFVDHDIYDRVQSSIKSIAASLVDGQATQHETPILTVMNSDLYFMLTIGDRVDTISCMNLESGSGINSLMGYMDPNTRAVASFILSARQFAKIADYERVVEALQRNEKIDVDFNGNKLTAEIIFADGYRVHVQFDQAHLRNIIKFGYNNDHQPAVFLEESYFQTHDLQPLMAKAHEKMLRQTAQEMNAQVEGKNILVPATRNTYGGVYSDVTGRIQFGNYRVNP